jgi:hypothetical protein
VNNNATVGHPPLREGLAGDGRKQRFDSVFHAEQEKLFRANIELPITS